MFAPVDGCVPFPAHILQRSPSPSSWNGNDGPAGTRDDPLQICESDDEVATPVGPSLAVTRSHVRAAARRGKNDLGTIELSDSEHEVATAASPVDSRRKRRKTTCTTDARPKKEPDVHVKTEVGVLQDSPPYKQRKLNHADDGWDDKRNTEPLSNRAGSASTARTAVHPKAAIQDTKAEMEEEADLHARTTFEECPRLCDESDEAKPQAGNLIKPKAEIKKEYLLKDEDLLELISPDALKAFPITLDEDKSATTVTRPQLTRRFGGGGMETFPRPNKNRIAMHGRSNFMCISLDWNPHGPQKPGHGGLFFETTVWPGDAWTANKKHSRTQTLFVKLKPNQWLYLGEYELVGHTPLTVQQWQNLHEKVRSTWAHEISKSGWGTPIRARIHLRRSLGRNPAREEVETALGKFNEVSAEDVRDALDAGQECICAWSMKCIGYDEDFQLELVELSRSF
ncbi:hypothetical protein OH76DRAFT_1483902 [Lentinus brumalis]|uniref:DUF6697 domain-containing protein n=1 Tax=Lentinus brumalis TaxID=2498619 RepID=A0A371D7P1_9APHY|nr:hypothetical protein OH76DRAFT_1483902 [Polyporus brumalis]